MAGGSSCDKCSYTGELIGSGAALLGSDQGLQFWALVLSTDLRAGNMADLSRCSGMLGSCLLPSLPLSWEDWHRWPWGISFQSELQFGRKEIFSRDLIYIHFALVAAAKMLHASICLTISLPDAKPT
jgi:hypothetical protein